MIKRPFQISPLHDGPFISAHLLMCWAITFLSLSFAGSTPLRRELTENWITGKKDLIDF